MQIVDTWAQITTERMARSEWMATLLRWTGRENQVVTPTLAETLNAMDNAGVSTTLLSAWYGPEGCLISNDEVRSQIAGAPDRFRGLASADVRRPAEALAEIRDALEDPAFVGVRIVPWLWNIPPDHRYFYPLYALCAERNVPLCLQVGHTGPLRSSEPGRPIPYLENVLLDFPDLTIVGGHVGAPWLPEIYSLVAKFRNFHLDTSAYALHRLPRDFVTFMQQGGKGRVMFGTNWPMLSPARCLDGLSGLRLDDETRAAFLYGTARRVFQLDARGAD